MLDCVVLYTVLGPKPTHFRSEWRTWLAFGLSTAYTDAVATSQIAKPSDAAGKFSILTFCLCSSWGLRQCAAKSAYQLRYICSVGLATWPSSITSPSAMAASSWCRYGCPCKNMGCQCEQPYLPLRRSAALDAQICAQWGLPRRQSDCESGVQPLSAVNGETLGGIAF